MAILKFDENYNVNDFTFVLSTRSYVHQGALSNVANVVYKKNFNAANEISFDVYKVLDGHLEQNWGRLDDLKLIWVKDLDEYYTIEVTLKDGISPCKSITATSLCESELSQTNLYGIEINTESDIDRDDYVITKFYNSENIEGSLLHRILNKVPHYSIKHVDASLMNLQRSFSIDGTSIYDFFTGECSEQFNCIFQFDSTDRSISVYDLYTVCQDCGYRGDYSDECPECGSTNLKYYGDDTTIYIDKENLAEEISLTTDVGSIKNCFKLVAGDDYMTATIRNINPNGTDYIYRITDQQKEDMSQELVDRINEYDALYNSKIDSYTEIIANIYECIDKILYYTSEMMPEIEHQETTAQDEANKLTFENMNPVALTKISSTISIATVNSAVKNYAKIYIKSGYFKVEINESEFEYIDTDENEKYGYWTGNFKVTNYSDEEDIAYSPIITIKIIDGEDQYETFLRQKIDKLIASDSEDDESIYDVLGISDLELFKEALTYYCLRRLESFHDAIQGVIDIMIEEDQASEEADLYTSLYEPYHNKLVAVEEEMDKRQVIIDEWQNKNDNYEIQKKEIQTELNFEDFLGEELYKEFCAYRREDTYENSNYISDGLDNAEIFENAQDFMETAKKELFKSSERQKSISATLADLLVMKEFKPIINMFDVGNWIRIGIDGKIYRLRLISYQISFDSLQNIDVEFSNVTKVKDGASDIKSILDSAQSMASNYSYISKQAEKGNEASEDIQEWVKDGLDSSLVNIKNNENEEITYGKHGLLARSWDDITESYSDEQLKITHNILAFTNDAWKTSSLALGKHKYKYYDNDKNSDTYGTFVTDTGYGLTAKFVNAGYIHGSQIIGGDIYSENYSSTAGSYLNLNDGSFSFAGGKLTYNGENGLVLNGKIISTIGTIGCWNLNDSSIYKGDSSFGSKDGMYFGTDGLSLGSTFQVTSDGVATLTGANVTGTINTSNLTATGGTIAGFNIGNTSIYKGTDSLSSTTSGIYLGIDGIRQYASSSAYVNISNGILTANGANISGTITAKAGGTIGGWNITETGLSAKTGSMYMNSDSTIGGTNWNITSAGLATFQDISISGGTVQLGDVTINSDGILVSGSTGKSSLGSFTVDNNSIFKGSWSNGTPEVFMCSGTNGSYTIGGVKTSGWAFGAGTSFGVTNTGNLYCSSGTIGGWTINSNSLYGTASASDGNYMICLYPNGKTYAISSTSNALFFIVIYNSNKIPIGGICTSGWKSIYGDAIII